MRNLTNKYRKKFLDTFTKIVVDPLKAAFKKVFHKATAKETGEFSGSKATDKIVKPKYTPDEIQKMLKK